MGKATDRPLLTEIHSESEFRLFVARKLSEIEACMALLIGKQNRRPQLVILKKSAGNGTGKIRARLERADASGKTRGPVERGKAPSKAARIAA